MAGEGTAEAPTCTNFIDSEEGNMDLVIPKLVRQGTRALGWLPPRIEWYRKTLGILAALALAALSSATPAAAVNVGYYEMCTGQGEAWQVPPITTAGETPVLLTDLASGDL